MTGISDDQKDPNDNKDNTLDYRNEHLTDDVVPSIPRQKNTAPDHPKKDTNIDTTEEYQAGTEEAAETKIPDHLDDTDDDDITPISAE